MYIHSKVKSFKITSPLVHKITIYVKILSSNNNNSDNKLIDDTSIVSVIYLYKPLNYVKLISLCYSQKYINKIC